VHAFGLPKAIPVSPLQNPGRRNTTMRSRRMSVCFTATLVLFAATLFANDARASTQETVLHNFKSRRDPQPWCSVQGHTLISQVGAGESKAIRGPSHLPLR
jgi:hypothetical protein